MRTPLHLLPLPALLAAQSPEAPKPAPEAPPALRPGEAEPKPYAKVVTPDYRTQAGVFRIHTLRGRILAEIPRAQLGKDFLLSVRFKRTPAGTTAFPGQEVCSQVLRFELREHKVLARLSLYPTLSDPATPFAQAVEALNTDPILLALPVEAFGADGEPVVDLTRLFTTDIAEIPVKKTLTAGALDPGRTFVEKTSVFPANLNVEVTQTFGYGGAGGSFKPGQAPPEMPRTALVHYALAKLPETPMQARFRDERVGFFSHSVTDFADTAMGVRTRDIISRWRLEKKDPAAARSEPVKPITWYVDPATPAALVPYVKQAVEAWAPAFEAAGFVHAIRCLEAPADPAWSPEDVRYSVIRWVPSTTPNARGPRTVDPRSGEILVADVEIYSNIVKLVTEWYFTQVGPLDPRARTLPLPDELMGELVRYVVCHEVGHSLGLQHNFKASATYPAEKLRDRAWLEEMGHTPSIMDYARFNYLVQPEDGIPPALLIPRIGPYDRFAIHWGYAPVPGATTPQAEAPTLDAWCRPQEATPWLRFSTPDTRETDPGEETEAVGDQDPVLASTLGIKNLKRVMAMIPGATLKAGRDVQDLKQMYRRVWTQYHAEIKHVAALVGGFDSVPLHGARPGPRFTPVSRDRQRAAIRFLDEQLFRTPTWLLDRDLHNRIAPDGGLQEVLSIQILVLSDLLRRAERLQDHMALEGPQAYTAGAMLADLRDGLFSELKAPAPRIDLWRRNAQRAYVEQVGMRLNMATLSGNPNDNRLAYRMEFKTLLARISARIPAASDPLSRAHLEDLKVRIERILDPKGPAYAGGGSQPAAPAPAKD